MASNIKYTSIAELPNQLRLFPLSGATLLPGSFLPLNIFEPRYLSMVDDALSKDRLIGMIQPKLSHDITPNDDTGLEKVGCAGRIIQLAETGDGRYRITLYGIARFNCLDFIDSSTPFLCHKVDFSHFADDLQNSTSEFQLDRDKIQKILELFAEIANINIEKNEVDNLSSQMLINTLATIGNFTPIEKQALLEASDISVRAELLYSLAELMLVKKQSGKDIIQ